MKLTNFDLSLTLRPEVALMGTGPDRIGSLTLTMSDRFQFASLYELHSSPVSLLWAFDLRAHSASLKKYKRGQVHINTV